VTSTLGTRKHTLITTFPTEFAHLHLYGIAVEAIGKALKDGAKGKYKKGHVWREKRAPEHVRHAIDHLEAYLRDFSGREDKMHLRHALCRIAMSIDCLHLSRES